MMDGQPMRRALEGFISERGTALIETVITSLMLILLLLGAVEMGGAAYAAIEVANAARAAAQYGAMNGGAFLTTDATGLDSVGMLNAARADAGNLSSPVQFSVNYPTYTCTCTKNTDTASCTPPNTPSGCVNSHLVVTVVVKTQATYSPPAFIPGFAHTSITLHGSSQQEVLQ